jgi:hypothetical protein
MEKGSMLVLAIIATMILSLILVAGLTVSTTEVHTTQNHYLNKVSYYSAIEGLELVIEQIRNEPNPENIEIAATDFQTSQAAIQKLFITGSLVEMQAGSTQKVRKFVGFPPPPLPGISLGPGSGISPILWYVPITSKVTVNKKIAYTELEAGIYSSVTIAY